MNDAVQQSVSREGLRAESPDSVNNRHQVTESGGTELPNSRDTIAGIGTSIVPALEIPGSRPLHNRRLERFCHLCAQMRPKADAYRQAGYKSESDHAAAGNASRLLRRIDVQDRIAYWTRQEEEILQAKRRRLEEFLWNIHEANIAQMWEMQEVPAYDRKGNPIIDGETGKPATKLVQRPKAIHEMPEDVQRAVESISINEAGFVVPKPYSKLQANQELRKLLGIGVTNREDGELSRLSDQELVAQLANQARELGVEIDLSYRFGSGG